MSIFKGLIGAIIGAFAGFALAQVFIFMTGTNYYVDQMILWKDIPDFEFTFRWIWDYGRSYVMSIMGVVLGALGGFEQGHNYER